jgi:fluoroacetyl-CoA thioesterase
MKSRPKIGTVGEQAFLTEAKHAVEFAGNGMPAVVSTPSLVGFLERTARETIADCLDADERSVGTELDIRHLAPTPVGQTIHCRAQVITVEDRKITFQIEARDAREVVMRGLHQRAIIHVESFSKRVQAKMG